MARHDRPILITPSSSNRMNIRAAHSTGGDFDVDIVVAKGLRFKLDSMSERHDHNILSQGLG